MTRDAPNGVWNEIRVSDDGISISLYSEGPETGAVVEDEAWFTFDELAAMSPTEPISLRLTPESREALSEAIVGNLEYETQNEPVVSEGDLVRDTNPPSWSDENQLRVVEYLADVRADEFLFYAMDEDRVNTAQSDIAWHEDTVADANPSCDPSAPVVICEYTGPNSTDEEYAFPLSRLEPVDTEVL